MEKSAIAAKTKVMTAAEFKEWLKDKKVYSHVVHWIERWEPEIFRGDKVSYIPYGNIILRKSVKLADYPYPGYGKKCRSHTTTTGKDYWDMEHWKASYNEKNQRVYVTGTWRDRDGKEK